MEELLRVFGDIIKQDIALLTEKDSIASNKALDIGITFEEARKNASSNYKGFNIYLVEGKGRRSYLLVRGKTYSLSVEIKVMIEAIRDKMRQFSSEDSVITKILEGNYRYTDVNESELVKCFPLYIGVIDNYGIYEEEIVEIFNMIMDCKFIVPYEGRLVAGFSCDRSDLERCARNFVQNAVGDLLTQSVFAIGGMAYEVSDIRKRYEDGLKAIEIKSAYGIKDDVLIFNNMYDFLIVDSISDATKQLLVDRIFTKEMDKLLNRDMMETIEAFFKYNLNITDTANSLYIHRNTLIYRLDKIHKLCGFDLRIFGHSAVFELAYIAWKEQLYENKN